MSFTKSSLSIIKEKFYDTFCVISAKPVDEKWATCYNCNIALRVISHIPINEYLNKLLSQHIPLGVCLEINIPVNKLISIIHFERTNHVILCIKCLGDSFLATDGSLFTRCAKCLCFFNNVESSLDGMYWEGFQGTEYDMHIVSCKKLNQKSVTRFVPKKLIKVKPFLLRKNQINDNDS